LSWFQPGGKRWFATAVADFLTKMQNDIELSASVKPEVVVGGDATSPTKYPIWNPSNRRLTLPL
jgi:hypothetical protein